MKQFKGIVILFFIVCTVSPLLAQAHVLEVDNSIGAVLHIDPEDDPLTRQVSKMYFELKDKTGKFKVAECDCELSIKNSLKQELERVSKPDIHPNSTVLTYSYVFPVKGIYTLEIVGKPLVPNAF